MLAEFPWISWLPAGLYLTGAALCTLLPAPRGWPALAIVTRAALAAALLVEGASLWRSGHGLPPATDAAGALLALLIAFLGWIIGDYSRRYLRGEPGQGRFLVAYLATLAAVSSVVASGHLALLIAAWAASSISLHHLLTFYPERRAAIVVAHKKFLASRLAELCLLAAAVLLYREWGSLDLAAIATSAARPGALPASAHLAATLIAIAVLLKCAQLPLHGWLIQVMEAPTPVSALLHAGVVNLGGYVLIRLAPLISASMAAQTVLVAVGSLTAVIAGLVMLTRITIKVRLAWSTCSQMGLMVMECGLGLYDLALIHLLAHALYKAYAFLTAGEAVRNGLERAAVDIRPRELPPLPWLAPTLALGLAIAIIGASSAVWHRAFGAPELAPINVGLLAAGIATLLWSAGGSPGLFLRALGSVIAVAQLYLGWHWLVTGALGIPQLSAPIALQVWALLAFVTLYYTQTLLAVVGAGAVPTALYDWIYAGLYLDERYTRLTFRVWPPNGASGNLSSRPASHMDSQRYTR